MASQTWRVSVTSRAAAVGGSWRPPASEAAPLPRSSRRPGILACLLVRVKVQKSRRRWYQDPPPRGAPSVRSSPSPVAPAVGAESPARSARGPWVPLVAPGGPLPGPIERTGSGSLLIPRLTPACPPPTATAIGPEGTALGANPPAHPPNLTPVNALRTE